MTYQLIKNRLIINIDNLLKMLAGTRPGKVTRKSKTAAKKDKMLSSTSAQISDISLDSDDDSDIPHVSKPREKGKFVQSPSTLLAYVHLNRLC